MWYDALKISIAVLAMLLIVDARQAIVADAIQRRTKGPIWLTLILFWFSLFQVTITVLELFCHN